MLNRLRKRFDAAVVRRVDQRFDSLRADAQFAYRDDVAAIRDELSAMGGHFGADYGYMRAEFDRIAPQVAALEYRLESLRRTLALSATDADEAVARAELEHERARLRLELAAHYEERLRRLERDANA